MYVISYNLFLFCLSLKWYICRSIVLKNGLDRCINRYDNHLFPRLTYLYSLSLLYSNFLHEFKYFKNSNMILWNIWIPTAYKNVCSTICKNPHILEYHFSGTGLHVYHWFWKSCKGKGYIFSLVWDRKLHI